jgi:hypothetical protein
VNKLKSAAFQACLARVSANLESANRSLADIGESMANETKSSAGDKHETARARMHSEQEQLMRQAEAHRQQLADLERIMNYAPGEGVSYGSLVETNRGFFLLAVPPGKIQVEGHDIQVVSPASPFGKLLLGLLNHAEFNVDGLHYRLLNVY